MSDHKRMTQGVFMLCLVAMLGLTGCSYVQRGAAVGAGLGALTGGIIGHQGAEGVLEGAVMGAGGGGIIGALIGDGMQQTVTAEEIFNLQNQIDVLTAENARLKGENSDLKNKIKQLEDELAALRAKIKELEAENERLRNRKIDPAKKTVEITLDGDVLFASGSNQLTPEGMTILTTLAKELKAKYSGKAINVKGHTDSDPVRYSKWTSNWELGAARAVSVLHYLVEKQGCAAGDISATTFGEYKPVADNKTPAGQQKNRRSVISVSVEK